MRDIELSGGTGMVTTCIEDISTTFSREETDTTVARQDKTESRQSLDLQRKISEVRAIYTDGERVGKADDKFLDKIGN